MGISTFVVGHVTKEGSLAGPKLTRAYGRYSFIFWRRKI